MQSSIEVRRIDLWSLFKVAFFAYAALGLIFGFIYAFFMLIVTGIGGAFIEEELPHLGLLGGVFGIILVPVLAFLYGAVGSVVATIVAGILNLIMKAVGGVKFDVNLVQTAQPVSVTAVAATAGPVATGGPPQATPPSGPSTPEGIGPVTPGSSGPEV
jgi:hypothetical protein